MERYYNVWLSAFSLPVPGQQQDYVDGTVLNDLDELFIIIKLELNDIIWLHWLGKWGSGSLNICSGPTSNKCLMLNLRKNSVYV